MSQHLDIDHVSELREVMEDGFSNLVETYLRDAAQRQSAIQVAFATVDNVVGRMEAHSLKGASANLGALQLSALCERLEHACRAGNISSSGNLIEEVSRELQLVAVELNALI